MPLSSTAQQVCGEHCVKYAGSCSHSIRGRWGERGRMRRGMWEKSKNAYLFDS